MNARVLTNARGRKSVTAPCERPCAIERAMRLLGGKWTGSILWHLRDAPVRFNDLTRMIPGASRKVIAQRLAAMEDEGLLSHHVLRERPLAVEYRITPLGRGAVDGLDALRAWIEGADR